MVGQCDTTLLPSELSVTIVMTTLARRRSQIKPNTNERIRKQRPLIALPAIGDDAAADTAQSGERSHGECG
jgi:hypothetical protein